MGKDTKFKTWEELLYERAIKQWGVSLQLIMTLEEMSELSKEITKHLRGNLRRDKMMEEIADVEIMLGQLKVMFDIGKKELWAIQQKKLTNLDIILEEQRVKKIKPK